MSEMKRKEITIGMTIYNFHDIFIALKQTHKLIFSFDWSLNIPFYIYISKLS